MEDGKKMDTAEINEECEDCGASNEDVDLVYDEDGVLLCTECLFERAVGRM